MYDSEFKFEYDLLDQFQNNLNTHIEQFDVLFKQYVETSKIVKRYKSRTNPTKADENIAIESFKFFNPTVSLESMDIIHIEGFLDNIKQALTTVIEKIQENVKKVKTVMSNVGASVEHFCKGYDLRFLDYENKIQKVLSHENIKVENSIAEYYINAFPLFINSSSRNISEILEESNATWKKVFGPLSLSLQDTLNIIKKKEYEYDILSNMKKIKDQVNKLLSSDKKCILITNVHKYNVTSLAADNDGNVTREKLTVNDNKKYVDKCLETIMKEEQSISKDILEPLIRYVRTELLPHLSKLKQTIDKYYSEIFTSLDKEKRDIERDDDIENNEDAYRNRIKSLKGLSNQWKLDLVHFSSYFIKTIDHFFNLITSNVDDNNENNHYKAMLERIKDQLGNELPNARI